MASQDQAQQLLDGPAPSPGAGMPVLAPGPQPTPANTREPGSEDEIMLLVVDGNHNCYWRVSKRLLCERAPIFQNATSTINIPGWRPETVQSFVDWVKTGEVRVRGLVDGRTNVNAALHYEPSHNHRGTWMRPEPQAADDLRPWYAIFGDDAFAWTLCRVLDLYSFAVVGGMKALMTDCVLVWQRRICAPHNVAVFAPLLNAVVRHGRHGVGSPLTSFLVDWIALTADEDSWDAAQFKSLPPNIVAEIFRRTLRRARYGVDTATGVPDPNLDWCRYHAHGPGQEQVACMARRPFDSDVRARLRQVAPAEPQYLFTANHQAVRGALPPLGPIEGQAQNVGLAGIKAEEGPKIKADEQKPSVNAKRKKRPFNPKPCTKAVVEKPKLKTKDQLPDLKAEEEEPLKKKQKGTTK